MSDALLQILFAAFGIVVVFGFVSIGTGLTEYLDEATRAKRAQTDAYRDISRASLIAAKAYAGALSHPAKGEGGGDG